MKNLRIILAVSLFSAGGFFTYKNHTIALFSNTVIKKFKKVAGETEYKGREGIEFYPQEIMIFSPDNSKKRAGKDVVWVQNFQTKILPADVQAQSYQLRLVLKTRKNQ